MADDAPDPILEALWQRVLESWDDDRTHAAALEQGLRAQALPDLAARYRALADDPARGPLAKKKLDAIVIAATHQLFSQKTPPPGRVPLPITLSAAGVCFFLLAWLMWALHARN